MSRVTLGLLLAMASLIILHRNQPFLGLPLFVVGVFLMMRKK